MGDLLDALLARQEAAEEAAKESMSWDHASAKPMDPWELSSFNPFESSGATSAADALLAFAEPEEQHSEAASSSSLMHAKPKKMAKKETMSPLPPAEPPSRDARKAYALESAPWKKKDKEAEKAVAEEAAWYAEQNVAGRTHEAYRCREGHPDGPRWGNRGGTLTRPKSDMLFVTRPKSSNLSLSPSL